MLLARCDAPEQGKDHGVVHLTWRNPGSLLGAPEPNNQFAASLITAGYDLYRTDATIVGAPPALDIRALAAGVAHDSNGNVAIPGLVKVNDQPIVVSGSPEKEVRYQSFNAPYFQAKDAAAALIAAGLQPGDDLGYYLVGRDFTGNYGATAVAVHPVTLSPDAVTIPDTRPPPAPWKIRTVQKTYGSEEFRLVWDHVDVRNYYSDYQLGRTYCNLETARFDLELTYVAAGEDCETDMNREVPLDIADYLIYRFDTFEEARRFTDTDGDGVSDADERVASGALAFPEYSEPGTACDDTMQPGGASLPVSLLCLPKTLSDPSSMHSGHGSAVRSPCLALRDRLSPVVHWSHRPGEPCPISSIMGPLGVSGGSPDRPPRRAPAMCVTGLRVPAPEVHQRYTAGTPQTGVGPKGRFPASPSRLMS